MAKLSTATSKESLWNIVFQEKNEKFRLEREVYFLFALLQSAPTSTSRVGTPALGKIAIAGQDGCNWIPHAESRRNSPSAKKRECVLVWKWRMNLPEQSQRG